MPEKVELEILQVVRDHWPISALEVAEHLRHPHGDRAARRRLSARYSYYLKKLVSRRLVLSKRVGHALIVWPLEVEKYRTIHSILSDHARSD